MVIYQQWALSSFSANQLVYSGVSIEQVSKPTAALLNIHFSSSQLSLCSSLWCQINKHYTTIEPLNKPYMILHQWVQPMDLRIKRPNLILILDS